MESYINQAPGIFFATSDDGTLLEINRALCYHTGYEPEELVGVKANLIYPVATRIFYQTHFYPLLKMHGSAQEIFIMLRHKDGTDVPVLISAERIENGGKYVILFMGILVKNRKKFEDELITAKHTAEKALLENSELLQAKELLQKHAEELDEKIQVTAKQNEELKQVSRVVTHDMQEPLRKLSVFSNMIVEEVQLAQQRNIAVKVHRVTEQMRNVLSGLQQYVWLNEAQPKIILIDLNKLVLVILKKLEQEFAGISIQCEMKGTNPVYGDWDQMLVLFYQLLHNAVRFRNEVDAASIQIQSTALRLNKFKSIKGKYKFVDFTRIEIKDKGKGFDERFAAQAFDLFKHLHEESGMGVGLALCKKIVDNHRGSIGIKTIRSRYTLVTIELPVHAGIEESSEGDLSMHTDSVLKDPEL